MVIETKSPEETFQLGEELGRKAVPGQVFTLTGDLGVGKTVFTQGLAKGLDRGAGQQSDLHDRSGLRGRKTPLLSFDSLPYRGW